ncbi:hypothetical protein [Magnetofaba australis]|uniref:Uncharacterized protein n=1 Tax=Magnetofaba australis IT-1 TaxID=1434232 RepID=A0A1Y2JZ50_9PROT|nr:hypothetical protein [Magnetofaba australis]OSM00156.1 hypothetical protein MAIT1_00594 [Magnetofaba australis IT-1]
MSDAPENRQIPLELNPDAAAELDRIKSELGLERDVQVLQRAMALLSMAVKLMDEKGRIHVKDGDRARRIHLR